MFPWEEYKNDERSFEGVKGFYRLLIDVGDGSLAKNVNKLYFFLFSCFHFDVWFVISRPQPNAKMMSVHILKYILFLGILFPPFRGA